MDALASGDVPAYMDERDIANVLVTRGEQGASLYSGGKRLDFPPRTVVGARDTTGAGDLLVALLLSGLHASMAMEPAVRSAMQSVEDRLAKGIM
jgi:sugar/nucleoside kinase (ribokinase family)